MPRVCRSILIRRTTGCFSKTSASKHDLPCPPLATELVWLKILRVLDCGIWRNISAYIAETGFLYFGLRSSSPSPLPSMPKNTTSCGAVTFPFVLTALFLLYILLSVDRRSPGYSTAPADTIRCLEGCCWRSFFCTTTSAGGTATATPRCARADRSFIDQTKPSIFVRARVRIGGWARTYMHPRGRRELQARTLVFCSMRASYLGISPTKPPT